MAQVPLTTWKDVLDHLVDFLGANASREVYRDARRASLAAYREMPTKHRWTYYYARGRLNTVAPYSTGTVQYRQSSGTAPRLVTLTGGTWPSWAMSPATIQLTPALTGLSPAGPIEYAVDTQLDGQNITLMPDSNPGQDLPAGQNYVLWLDAYPLPADWLAFDELMNATLMIAMQFVHPSTWLAQHRHTASPGTPHRYTVMGDPAHYGSNTVRFFPAPDNTYAYDFIYQRRPRPLTIDLNSTGTANANAGGVLVGGTGTNWPPGVLGSVFRFGADAKVVPTGMEGLTPFVEERIVTGYNGPTSLSLDSTLANNYPSNAFAISDPIDIEEGAMLTAFLRCCESQVSRSRTNKERAEIEAAYRRALTEAREADSRNFGPRVAGERPSAYQRLAYMPQGPDIG